MESNLNNPKRFLKLAGTFMLLIYETYITKAFRNRLEGVFSVNMVSL